MNIVTFVMKYCIIFSNFSMHKTSDFYTCVWYYLLIKPLGTNVYIILDGYFFDDRIAAARRKRERKEVQGGMTDKELHKLRRGQLLELLLAQSREIDRLRAQVRMLQGQVQSREIKIKESGSIAEASLKLSRVFEDAQRAADLYLENVKRQSARSLAEEPERSDPR